VWGEGTTETRSAERGTRNGEGNYEMPCFAKATQGRREMCEKGREGRNHEEDKDTVGEVGLESGDGVQ
jgi:hypothetical protein